MSSTDNKGSFNWMNWVLGIAATVIGAVCVAVVVPIVTGNEETPTPVYPSPFPQRQADIKILNLPTVTLASASEEKSMQVEVFNEGNIAAESCQIQMNDEAGDRLTNSSFFGLVAGETETVDLILGPFDQSMELDAITVSLQVICANTQSPIYKVVFSILP